MGKQHFYENALILDEYPKAFEVLSKPQPNCDIEIDVSYKDDIKKLGLVKLKNTDLAYSGQAYFFYLGKGYSDADYCFMNQPENFEDQNFTESLWQQEISKDKQQIKLFLVDSTDFVELGDALLHAIFDRFTSDEVYYGYIHKSWKKK